jgi:hypothetical protein
MTSVLLRLIPAPLALSPLLLLAACEPKAPDQAAAPTVEGTSAAEVSTEWTAENPTEPAVPVELPTTHMTNAPVAVPAPK